MRTYKQQQGEGKWAFRDGLELSDNPYYDESEESEDAAGAFDAWEMGYKHEQRLSEVEVDAA